MIQITSSNAPVNASGANDPLKMEKDCINSPSKKEGVSNLAVATTVASAVAKMSRGITRSARKDGKSSSLGISTSSSFDEDKAVRSTSCPKGGLTRSTRKDSKSNSLGISMSSITTDVTADTSASTITSPGDIAADVAPKDPRGTIADPRGTISGNLSAVVVTTVKDVIHKSIRRDSNSNGSVTSARGKSRSGSSHHRRDSDSGSVTSSRVKSGGGSAHKRRDSNSSGRSKSSKSTSKSTRDSSTHKRRDSGTSASAKKEKDSKNTATKKAVQTTATAAELKLQLQLHQANERIKTLQQQLAISQADIKEMQITSTSRSQRQLLGLPLPTDEEEDEKKMGEESLTSILENELLSSQSEVKELTLENKRLQRDLRLLIKEGAQVNNSCNNCEAAKEEIFELETVIVEQAFSVELVEKKHKKATRALQKENSALIKQVNFLKTKLKLANQVQLQLQEQQLQDPHIDCSLHSQASTISSLSMSMGSLTMPEVLEEEKDDGHGFATHYSSDGDHRDQIKAKERIRSKSNRSSGSIRSEAKSSSSGSSSDSISKKYNFSNSSSSRPSSDDIAKKYGIGMQPTSTISSSSKPASKPASSGSSVCSTGSRRVSARSSSSGSVCSKNSPSRKSSSKSTSKSSSGRSSGSVCSTGSKSRSRPSSSSSVSSSTPRGESRSVCSAPVNSSSLLNVPLSSLQGGEGSRRKSSSSSVCAPSSPVVTHTTLKSLLRHNEDNSYNARCNKSRGSSASRRRSDSLERGGSVCSAPVMNHSANARHVKFQSTVQVKEIVNDDAVVAMDDESKEESDSDDDGSVASDAVSCTRSSCSAPVVSALRHQDPKKERGIRIRDKYSSSSDEETSASAPGSGLGSTGSCSNNSHSEPHTRSARFIQKREERAKLMTPFLQQHENQNNSTAGTIEEPSL